MTPPRILSGHFVLDSDEVISTIKGEFDRYKKSKGLVIIIFCPKNSRYYDQLAKNADFWNRYSDEYVTILIPGYVGYLSRPKERFHDNVQTEFSFDDYKEVYQAFEESSSWSYKGGTDLIALVITKRDDELVFNYKNGIAVNIESLDTDGKFDFHRYVLQLINSAKASPDDPLLEMAKNETVSFLISVARSALPQNVRGVFDNVVNANLRRVTDVSPG